MQKTRHYEILTPRWDFYITVPVPKAQGSLGKKNLREGPEVVDDYAGIVCYGHQAVTLVDSEQPQQHSQGLRKLKP